MSHRFLLLAVLASCGIEAPSGPQAVIAVPASGIELADAGPADAGFPLADAGSPWAPFISRFGPSQGLVGSRVRILGTFVEHVQGPPELGDVSVTIGGEPAAIQPGSNEGYLEVEVPFAAVSGPVCVSFQTRTTCGERFTVLRAPIVYSASPSPLFVAAQSLVIQVTGDGFAESSQVRINGRPLDTTFISVNSVEATVPTGFFQMTGTALLTIVTWNSRCPTPSEPLSIAVENPQPHLAELHLLPRIPGEFKLVGDGFIPDSAVFVDGAPVAVTSTAGASIRARLDAATLPGEHVVQVRNPEPGGGSSAPLTFTVQ